MDGGLHMYRWGPGRARRGNETMRLSTSSSSLQPIPLALFTSLLFCPLFYSRYLLFYSPSVRAWRVLLLTGGERPLGHITHLDLCVTSYEDWIRTCMAGRDEYRYNHGGLPAGLRGHDDYDDDDDAPRGRGDDG